MGDATACSIQCLASRQNNLMKLGIEDVPKL